MLDYNKPYETGRADGRKEGRREGKEEGITQVISEMLKDDLDINIIAKYSNMPIKKIQELKKNL